MTPREEVFMLIQSAIAGQCIADALPALVDALAGFAGYIADSPADAEIIIEELVPDLKRAMRENWREIQRARRSTNGSPARR